MNLIIWVAEGAIVGALAFPVLGSDFRRGVWINVAIGIVAAVFTGWLIGPLLGTPSVNQGRFKVGAAVVPPVGALLAVVVARAVMDRRKR